MQADNIQYYYDQIKELKVLKNFGSNIKSIEPITGTGISAALSGFNINFTGGDTCIENPNIFYTSEI